MAHIHRPSWTIRRRIIIGALLFCAGVIFYLTLWGEDVRLHETIALSAFGAGMMIIGSYVFGAAWDDRNVMQMLGREAYTDRSSGSGNHFNRQGMQE